MQDRSNIWYMFLTMHLWAKAKAKGKKVESSTESSESDSDDSEEKKPKAKANGKVCSPASRIVYGVECSSTISHRLSLQSRSRSPVQKNRQIPKTMPRLPTARSVCHTLL